VLDDGLDGTLDRMLEVASDGVLDCEANGRLERMLDGTFDGCLKGKLMWHRQIARKHL
jgi:hypothetical protein